VGKESGNPEDFGGAELQRGGDVGQNLLGKVTVLGLNFLENRDKFGSLTTVAVENLANFLEPPKVKGVAGRKR